MNSSMYLIKLMSLMRSNANCEKRLKPKVSKTTYLQKIISVIYMSELIIHFIENPCIIIVDLRIS